MQESASIQRSNSRSVGFLLDSVSSGSIATIISVVTYASLIGISAQFSFHLNFTPVPITLQTFAVLFGGAALGSKRAVSGTLLYMIVGLIGLPWFAGATGGISVASSPSMGYIVGFVFASYVVGLLAERGWDRNVAKTLLLVIVGNAVIYLFGASWLALSLGVTAAKAYQLGVSPFLIGDALKAVLATVALPVAWLGLSKLEGHKG